MDVYSYTTDFSRLFLCNYYYWKLFAKIYECYPIFVLEKNQYDFLNCNYRKKKVSCSSKSKLFNSYFSFEARPKWISSLVRLCVALQTLSIYKSTLTGLSELYYCSNYKKCEHCIVFEFFSIISFICFNFSLDPLDLYWLNFIVLSSAFQSQSNNGKTSFGK